MKVLWFSITPAKYGKYASNGGGWIEALQRVVQNETNITLGISFVSLSPSKTFKCTCDNVTYYPIYNKRNIFQRWFDEFTYKTIDSLTLDKCQAIINDFQPDIIHVFGSEWCFGLLAKYTHIPIVIHIQGCWPVYHYIDKSVKQGRLNFYLERIFKPLRLFRYLLNQHKSEERVVREEEILALNRDFMGRTIWDRALIRLFSPSSHYYYCSEAIRNEFVKSKRKQINKKKSHFVFATTGLATDIKGYDVILIVARLLKKYGNFDFEWHLIGPTVQQMIHYEKNTGIMCSDVNLVPCGNKDAKDLLLELQNADLYVHASYIDNSPNSICEAQLIGLPVISTNVGGISSLFLDTVKDESLVPANDPYYMASHIISIINDQNAMIRMADANYTFARNRHNDKSIAKSLISCYNAIIESRNCNS